MVNEQGLLVVSQSWYPYGSWKDWEFPLGLSIYFLGEVALICPCVL